MKFLVLLLCLSVIPVVVIADTHVDSISIVPENPDPMQPFHVYVEANLPDQCWSQGPIGDLEFTVLDSSEGEDCSGGIFLYAVNFEQEGLPEGNHSLTVTEIHDSVRDPGSIDHVVEFTVGDPSVRNDPLSWGAVKTLFR